MRGKRKWQLQGDLKSLLYPYGFVLKEGKNHDSDPFDFDLVLLQFKVAEKFSSPEKNDFELQTLAYKMAEQVRQRKQDDNNAFSFPPLYSIEQDEI